MRDRGYEEWKQIRIAADMILVEKEGRGRAENEQNRSGLVEEERKTSRTDQGRSRKSRKRTKQIRVKSYQNSIEIALRIGLTIMDRNKPTGLMSQKGWIRLLYRITSQHSEPLGDVAEILIWNPFSTQLNVMIGLTEGGRNLVNILSECLYNPTPHTQ